MDSTIIADKFVEAFYSFDQDRLESMLSSTDKSRMGILYYQKWSQCGNYKVLKKGRWIQKNDSIIHCPVTVEDDLIGALKVDFHVTDTFKLTLHDGNIKSVQTSSNDPEAYFEARKWIEQNLPELIEKPCEGIWEDGTTPCACVKAMVKGYSEFKKVSDSL